MRDPDELLLDALAVIETAYQLEFPTRMIPLFSGGHDSYCACYVASQHPEFEGVVHHINTGIGSKKTREFVERVCREERWKLKVWKSRTSYEYLVRKGGFPGPPQHNICYNSLKKECINSITKHVGGRTAPKQRFALISGARQQESKRRMKNVDIYMVGDTLNKRTGKTYHPERIWVHPCFDWSSEEQRSFMDAFALPRNPVKMSPLAMSGECFCGAFARPNELETIRDVCPDVAQEIDRLSKVAGRCGHSPIWGYNEEMRRKGGNKTIQIVETGPLCASCDYRARGAGIEVVQNL